MKKTEIKLAHSSTLNIGAVVKAIIVSLILVFFLFLLDVVIYGKAQMSYISILISLTALGISLSNFTAETQIKPKSPKLMLTEIEFAPDKNVRYLYKNAGGIDITGYHVHEVRELDKAEYERYVSDTEILILQNETVVTEFPITGDLKYYFVQVAIEFQEPYIVVQDSYYCLHATSNHKYLVFRSTLNTYILNKSDYNFLKEVVNKEPSKNKMILTETTPAN